MLSIHWSSERKPLCYIILENLHRATNAETNMAPYYQVHARWIMDADAPLYIIVFLNCSNSETLQGWSETGYFPLPTMEANYFLPVDIVASQQVILKYDPVGIMD